MVFEVDHADHLWKHAVKYTMMKGHEVLSRNGMSIEVLGPVYRVADITACFVFHPARKLKPEYAAGELLWYLSGSEDGEQIKGYAPSYDRFLNDGIAMGAYGKRWFDEGRIWNVIHDLRTKDNSRQAFLPFFEPKDVRRITEGGYNDIPCTIGIQFIARDGYLHAICTMRSNDVWFGLPYDIFCFMMLQQMIADELGLRYGFYQHQPGSLHIYDKHMSKAKEINDQTLSYYGKTGASLDFDKTEAFSKGSLCVATLQEQLIRTQTNYHRHHDSIIDSFPKGSRLGFLLTLALANFSRTTISQEICAKFLPVELSTHMMNCWMGGTNG